MLTVISKFFSTWGLRIVVVVGLVVAGYVAYLRVNLELTQSELKATKSELKTAQEAIAAQRRAIAAVDRIEELSDQLDQIVTNSTRRVLEAEGSTDEIPTDVAAAWAAGIDGLRNPATDSNP